MARILPVDENLRLTGPTAATVGKFDGVHVGHRAIVAATVAAAREMGGASVIFTLWPHPAVVLRPGTFVSLLAGLDDRLDLLAACGPDFVKVAAFDWKFSQQSAQEFLTGLRERVGLRTLVLGEDARVGRDRHAGVEELRAIAAGLGIRLHILEPVGRDGPVGSQEIRQAFARGDLRRATEMLGRLPSFAGTVVRGEERGRKLGFPTANLEVSADRSLPVHGVYAGSVLVGQGPKSRLLPAGISLGTRPTFGPAGTVLLEAHLLHFEGDLYGEGIRVYFEQLIRPEVKFDRVDELIAAIGADMAAVAARPRPDPSLYAPWFDPEAS